MASAWGDSWGEAWGDSWLIAVAEPEEGGSGGGYAGYARPRPPREDRPSVRRSVEILPWPLAATWTLRQPEVTGAGSANGKPMRTAARLLAAEAAGTANVPAPGLLDFPERELAALAVAFERRRARIMMEDLSLEVDLCE